MTSKSQTATPRTDAFVSRASCKGSNVTDDFSKKELADFARTLETELQQLRLAADGMAKAWEQSQCAHCDGLGVTDIDGEPLACDACFNRNNIIAAYRAAGEGATSPAPQ